MASNSGQTITTVPSTSGQDTEITSIIGFAAVLVILVAAIVAVLFLCTCYGLCKLHSQSVESGQPESNLIPHRTGMIPLPSPREHISPAVNARTKSPSFQNSVDLNVISEPLPSASMSKPTAINSSRKLLCQPDQSHLLKSETTCQPRHIATLPPLQLLAGHIENQHLDCTVEAQNLNIPIERHDLSKSAGYTNGYRHSVSPMSASGDVREKRMTQSIERNTVSAMACRITKHSYSTEV